MRPHLILATVLLAAVVVGTAWLLSHNRGTAGSPAANTEMAAPAPQDTRDEAVAAPIAAPPADARVLTPEQREAAIAAETDRLQQWSMKSDPASLASILSDLTSPEKDIREAAIEAAKQFDSTNAIPALKAAAAAADDPHEKIELLEAAEFLSLPSLNSTRSGTPKTPEQIQAIEQQRARDAARQPPHPPRGDRNPAAPGQNPSSGPNQ
jgi:hypothetical protein